MPEELGSSTTRVGYGYGGLKIQMLEGPGTVRKCLGAYIDSTSESGLHHLMYGITDNSVGEALAGYCDETTVKIGEGDIVTVIDNGRDIPVDIQPQTGLPVLEVVFTIFHTDGKFGGGGCKVSGDLRGMGASVVSAPSERLGVRVRKEGKVYGMKLSRDKATRPTQVVGDTDRHDTEVMFKPDPEMFKIIECDYDALHTRMREKAFLNAGLKIHTTNERPGREQEDIMHYVGGIREFVSFLNQFKDPVHPDVAYVVGRKDGAMAKVVLQYDDGYSENIVSSANNVHTPEDGIHEEDFRWALITVLNNYGKRVKILKNNDKVSGEDYREGIACIISVKLTEAQFEGQTRAKLGNSKIHTLVDNVVTDRLSEYLEEDLAVGHVIPDKALMTNQAQEAARKVRESIRRKTTLGGAAMSDKLQDCNKINPEFIGLHIVEGDSAGGSAIQGRDSRLQAILPLWGKMFNVEKARVDEVYGNNKLTPVITALGAGIGDDLDLGKLHYHKIITMTDADADGSHIRALLLTFFFRFMRPFIKYGYVYAVMPPLFKLSRGETTRLAFSEEERGAISAELRGDNLNAEVDISRFKGLGEMDPHELWRITMDPKRCTLKRIELDDAVRADQIFTVLIGGKVGPCRKFTERNAKHTVNLDY